MPDVNYPNSALPATDQNGRYVPAGEREKRSHALSHKYIGYPITTVFAHSSLLLSLVCLLLPSRESGVHRAAPGMRQLDSNRRRESINCARDAR
jgi:hypothetical protein